MRGNEGGKGGKKRVRMVKFINKRRRRWRGGGRQARPISLIQPLAAPRCWMLVSFLTCGALSWPHGFPLCRFAFCSICSVDSITSRPIIAHQRSVITGCFIGLFVFVFFYSSNRAARRRFRPGWVSPLGLCSLKRLWTGNRFRSFN